LHQVIQIGRDPQASDAGSTDQGRMANDQAAERLAGSRQGSVNRVSVGGVRWDSLAARGRRERRGRGMFHDMVR
jgi:hypothetical protein